MIKLLREKDGEASFVPESDLKEKFAFYFKNPYLRKPFKKLLNEIAEQDEDQEWYLK